MALYGKVASPQVERGTIEVPKTQVTGLGWPIGKKNNQPFFNKATSRQLIKSQITQLLRTKKGERPMLPTFGLEVENYLFDPLTSQLATYIAGDIKRQVRQYAFNVDLVSIRVFQDDNIKGYGMPGINISLTVRPKNDNQNLDVEVVI
tara:strand:- start:1541 stop:1984 length:444 start_codon:yes stop_codon:yes gene_type:complete